MDLGLSYETAREHVRRNSRFEEKISRQSVVGYSWRRACARCELPPQLQSTRIMTLFILNLLYITILWIGVIYKAVNDSTQDYIQHFTNWMWTFAALYYTLDVLALMQTTRFFELLLLLGMWWVYFANAWVVFFLTFIMVYANPGIITDNFEENGGDYYAGTVLVGDRVFHMVPIVYTFIYLILRIPDFIDIYDLLLIPTDDPDESIETTRTRTDANYAMYAVVIFVMSLFPIFIYYNAFNINEVYEVDTPVWGGILLIASVVVLTTIGPTSLLSPIGAASRRQSRDTWTTSVHQASVRDRREFERDRIHERSMVPRRRYLRAQRGEGRYGRPLRKRAVF